VAGTNIAMTIINETNMKAHEALIAWTPPDDSICTATVGQVKVGRLLAADEADWTKPFACTGGAAFIETRKLRAA